MIGCPSEAAGGLATGRVSPVSVDEAPALQMPLEEVHGRRADEAGDEEVGRPVVEFERRSDLLDHAIVHHHDLVGHGHGLDLVVGDVDGGGLQPLVQGLDLRAHGDAQLGIEVGERLVEEEDLRIAHDGASHGDALALAARELARIAVEKLAQAEDLGGAVDAGLDLGLGRPLQLEREGHVVGDRHMRVERIVLEHHRDVALLGRNVVHDLRADAKLAAGHAFQSRDHAQEGGFAAAGRPDQDHELAVLDLDGDTVNDRDGSEVLSNVADLN